MFQERQWQEISLKYLFSDRTIGAWGVEPEDENDGVVCIRAADFITDQMRHVQSELTKRRYDPHDIETRQLQSGDLIIEKSGGGDNQPVGRVVSFELNETALCSNFLERLRPNPQILYSRFGAYFLYFLWSSRFVIPFIKQTTGIQNLDAKDYFQQVVKVPSLALQKGIAHYLDGETEQIDALVKAKERLLVLLDEKRRALITHAVTRGLNPAVPTRDSGVEWLGHIPSHWKAVSLKRVGQIGNGSTPLRDNEDYWKGGLYPWLTSTVVNDNIIGEPTDFVTPVALQECHLPIVKPNSILIAITGQGKTRGMAALLPYEATINQHMAYISPVQDRLMPQFLQLYLTGMYDILRMISEGMGSTKGALTIQQIAEFPLVLPPINEQKEIISMVNKSMTKLDSLTQVTRKTIDLLQERRTALIAAAVTGQIPIPETSWN